MSLELEENVPSTEEEEDEDEEEEEDNNNKRRSSSRRSKPPASAASSGGSKKKKKKNQPGKYSQLVVDTIRKLGERNGSSLTKIYGEAKKVSWFDQQNGRTYLKYSVKALVQNDTLVQVKGVGANGSFRLNKKKLEGEDPGEKKAAPPPAKAAAKKAPPPKKSHKKGAGKKEAPKKSHKAAAPAAPKKKATGGGNRKVKVGKPSRTRGHKARKA